MNPRRETGATFVSPTTSDVMVVSKLISLSLPAAHGGFSLRRGIRQYLPAKRKSPACEPARCQAAPSAVRPAPSPTSNGAAARLPTTLRHVQDRRCAGLNRLAALHRN